MSIRNIMSGFKVCGIYPFDQNALKLPLEADGNIYSRERKKNDSHHEKAQSSPHKYMTLIIDEMDKAKTLLSFHSLK